jgi:hypothetical protein
MAVASSIVVEGVRAHATYSQVCGSACDVRAYVFCHAQAWAGMDLQYLTTCGNAGLNGSDPTRVSSCLCVAGPKE